MLATQRSNGITLSVAQSFYVQQRCAVTHFNLAQNQSDIDRRCPQSLTHHLLAVIDAAFLVPEQAVFMMPACNRTAMVAVP